jgi:terminase small subunit / prophage DNA-packing protein
MAKIELPAEVGASALARLIGVTSAAFHDLARRGVFVAGKAKGCYVLDASLQGYCAHLRKLASGQGGESAIASATISRGKLAEAQATLAETKAKQLAGELVDAAEVERTWTSACKAIRSRVLAVVDRVRDLTAKQRTKLTAELRSALNELADGSV